MKRMFACLSENGLCTERRLVLSGLVQPACAQAHISKQSFFEKKDQKTFTCLVRDSTEKSFWFFFKKERFVYSARFSTPPYTTAPVG